MKPITQHIYIDNTEFAKAVADCQTMPFIEVESGNMRLSGYETEPIDGYKMPETFPYCCGFHTQVFEEAQKWLEKFPNCCKQHKELAKKTWFDKEDYAKIPYKVVNQILYTTYHISERLQTEDWYENITEYIEYNVESFGSPAIGFHLYLNHLKLRVKDSTDIPKNKKERILEFIEEYYKTPTPPKKGNTSLNVLYATYQKWLKIFPFEISYFAHLKTKYEKTLPFFDGKPKLNRYTGIAKTKAHTQESLIDVLLNLTDNLLSNINSLSLYENGLLTEPQKTKLELTLNERKMKLKQGYVNNSKTEEQRYRKILKEWFADEKRFIDEVTPLVKALPPQPGTNHKPPEITETLISFDSPETIDKIHNELKGYFPGKEKELMEALQGEKLPQLLYFPSNQNKFVEVFKRLKYNGYLLSKPNEIKNWICANFTYQYQRGKTRKNQNFNRSTIHDILTKEKGEPTKKERICLVEWLPYKSLSVREKEA